LACGRRDKRNKRFSYQLDIDYIRTIKDRIVKAITAFWDSLKPPQLKPNKDSTMPLKNSTPPT
jgi:hypothetical protein